MSNCESRLVNSTKGGLHAGRPLRISGILEASWEGPRGTADEPLTQSPRRVTGWADPPTGDSTGAMGQGTDVTSQRGDCELCVRQRKETSFDTGAPARA